MTTLGELDKIIKLQEQGEAVEIVAEFGGTYLKANNFLVQLNEFEFNQDYLIESSLKQLFFRKRKTGTVHFDGNDLLYGETALNAQIKPIRNLSNEDNSLQIIEFYNGKLNAIKMQIKEDVTNWSHKLFLVIQDGMAYFGLTNLSEFATLYTQIADDVPNSYVLLDYDQIMGQLNDVSSLLVAVDTLGDKAIIFDGIYGYQTQWQNMTSKQAKQFNILLTEYKKANNFYD